MPDALKIHRHKFCGVVHDIDLEPRYGSCDDPCQERPCLFVDWYNLSYKSAMEVAIHEALHACDWDKSEEKVEQTGKDIARFLWRLGYR